MTYENERGIIPRSFFGIKETTWLSRGFILFDGKALQIIL